ncbi:MAG: PspA/IM30 family protein [Halioglobus sp.]|nr:PspA/IM30 family protein [Halioglobus sp.]
MSESLISRVSRIVSGSINQLIEAAENAAPETIMAQAMREVESAIADVRDELGRVKAQKHNASKRLLEESNRHETLAEQIKVAINEGREDLGEAAVSTQLDIEAQLPLIEKTIADCAEREGELQHYVLALQARLREMQAELDQMKKTRDTISGSGESAVASEAGTGNVDRAVERANSVFDRVAGRATGTPAGAAATDPAKLAELEELARRNRVKERLEQLKRENG